MNLCSNSHRSLRSEQNPNVWIGVKKITSQFIFKIPSKFMDLAFKPLPICLQNTIQAYGYGACMFNVTFSNISAISWRTVLVVEEAGVSEENPRRIGDRLVRVVG